MADGIRQVYLPTDRIDLLAALDAQLASPPLRTFRTVSVNLFRSCIDAIADGDANVDSADADMFGQCVHTNYMNGLRKTVERDIKETEAFNTFLESAGFYDIAGLVSNQPQLLLTGKARLRDRIAGGDAFAIKLSFEFGLTGKKPEWSRTARGPIWP